MGHDQAAVVAPGRTSHPVTPADDRQAVGHAYAGRRPRQAGQAHLSRPPRSYGVWATPLGHSRR